jgi:hypothetical protein
MLGTDAMQRSIELLGPKVVPAVNAALRGENPWVNSLPTSGSKAASSACL